MDRQGVLFSEPDRRGSDLAAFNIIRTETVLSRLPVHNLSKKGKIDIRIVRRNQHGSVDLKWEVSYSERYGQPRQLAYKLDTLIVNKRLDAEARPLPKLIRIGSLKEICKELGMSENGKNTNDVRNSLLQNASAFITANLSYKGRDGAERRLEAGFTRYSIIFTGETLPNGHRADGVYVILNEPYREVVNHAPVRPLNYDYLRDLKPGAQRFYEVVSYRIYATLRNKRTWAKISYSDYCAYSAQQRYYDHEHFRVQMYKLQKPHLESGYLQSCHALPCEDAEGKMDWMLHYAPGVKARAEFEKFVGKSGSRDMESLGASTGEEEAIEEADSSLLQELLRRGINDRQAKSLLRGADDLELVAEQLEWGDWLIQQSPAAFRNPPGFYVFLIRDRLCPPDSFLSTRKQSAMRHRTEDLARRHQSEQLRHLAYEQYRSDAVDRYMSQHLPPESLSGRLAAKRTELSVEYSLLPPATLNEMALAAVRAEIDKLLDIKSLEEFILDDKA